MAQEGVPRPTAADPPPLTTADSVQIRVATVRLMRDSIAASWADAPTIWLRGVDRPSTAIRDALVAELPSLSPEPDDVPVFDCPPGVEVRLPTTSCPIHGGAVLLAFRPIVTGPGDTVETGGVVTLTEGGYTYSTGIGIRLGEDDAGTWRVVAVLWRSVT